MKNSLVNSVRLIGNVGNDPVLRTLTNGKKVAQFQVATNNRYLDNNGNKVTNTQWHNIVAWGKTAEIVEKYINKGKHLAINGSLNHRSYDNNQGNKVYVTEVLLEDVEFLDVLPK
jgi:single-strand DNA-binding protein